MDKRSEQNMRAEMFTGRKKPETPREYALYRVSLACKVGRDGLEGRKVPPGVTPGDWALYNLLHAVEDMALALGMDKEGKGNG